MVAKSSSVSQSAQQAGLTPGQYRQQARAAPAVAQTVQLDEPPAS